MIRAKDRSLKAEAATTRKVPGPLRTATPLASGTFLEDRLAAHSPSGIDLGGGCINLFYCPLCPHMPHAQWYDR